MSVDFSKIDFSQNFDVLKEVYEGHIKAKIKEMTSEKSMQVINKRLAELLLNTIKMPRTSDAHHLILNMIFKDNVCREELEKILPFSKDNKENLKIFKELVLSTSPDAKPKNTIVLLAKITDVIQDFGHYCDPQKHRGKYTKNTGLSL